MAQVKENVFGLVRLSGLFPHLSLSAAQLQRVEAGAEAGGRHDGLILVFLKTKSEMKITMS